jgi:hypothetical protein
MDVFISIILIGFLVLWLMVRFLPRILVWALNRKMRKMAENMNDCNRGKEEYSEGNVVVEQRREEKIVDDTIGEYVDFEETKE